MTATAANHDQAKQWNEGSGPVWVALQGILDRHLAPFEAMLTERAFPGAGKRVLDIGCGAGATTCAMAERLGPAGRALGVDISAPLIEAARAGAAARGARNARFEVGDAQTFAFEEGGFDAVISRMGVMFFEDPVAAFANIGRAAAPGARLAFIAWRSPAENPFYTAAGRALAPFMPAAEKPDPRAPGQFAFADEGYVRGILEAAGWRDIGIEALDVPATLAARDLMAFAAKMGPARAVLEALDEAAKGQAMAALQAAYGAFVEGDEVRATAACWWVEAGR